MENEKSIKVLNNLIEINNDRIEGYETALSETNESDLRSLFNRYIANSRRFKTELVAEVTRMGGAPEEGTRASGKIYRAWMEVKAALTGKDRKTVLNSCEYGEDVAVDTYKDAMEDHFMDLSDAQQKMVSSQYSQIKADHDAIRNLRDQAVEHA
jgi:uncharacterized protein (TIGR02284 family)